MTAVVDDISAIVGSSASFSGTNSTAQILSWSWSSVPGGSSIANGSIALPDNAANNTFELDMTDNEGLWHFEGNANDSSGNTRNGTVSGAAQTTGKVGSYAYNFVRNDNTDTITFGTAGFDFVSADAFSFSMWVKPDASQPDANAIIISKSNLTNNGYAIIQNGGANSNQYTLIVGTGSALSGIGSNFALTAGQWNHVAVTRAANGTSTKVYVNGSQVANVNFLTAIASSNPIALGIGNFGVQPGTAGLVFNGVIDEVAVWSRELAAYEVEAVYDYGSGNYAGFGTQLTFTPDVAGTYTVSAKARNVSSSDTTTADATVSSGLDPNTPPTDAQKTLYFETIQNLVIANVSSSVLTQAGVDPFADLTLTVSEVDTYREIDRYIVNDLKLRTDCRLLPHPDGRAILVFNKASRLTATVDIDGIPTVVTKQVVFTTLVGGVVIDDSDLSTTWTQLNWYPETRPTS